MSKIKKFRKNNWDIEEDVRTERKNPRVKRLNSALRTRDADYFYSIDDEDY